MSPIQFLLKGDTGGDRVAPAQQILQLKTIMISTNDEPSVRSLQNKVEDGALNRCALIAGGGIGVPALALSLHELAVPCTVLVAATEIQELGVGINILPHGTRALMSLSLLREFDDVAIRTRELRYVNHLGQ